MPDVVPQTDITEYIGNAIPPALTDTREYFTRLIDGLLNNSDATPRFVEAAGYFNQFETGGVSPLLVFDPKLRRYLNYDIRHLLALAIVDDGPSFYTQFFATFFDRFGLFYSDSNENKYESITGLISTDEGFVSDDNTFTDEGVGQGAYSLLAEVYFGPAEIEDIREKLHDVVHILMPMKPARLHVFVKPVLDLRLNYLLPSSPDYDDTLVTGDTAYFANVQEVFPSLLATDVVPPFQTDGDPAMQTDHLSTYDFLNSMSNLNVKYESDPLVVVQVPVAKKIIDMGDSYFYAGEATLPGNIVYLALAGASIPFTADIIKDIFIPEITADAQTLRIRISWLVNKGTINL